MSKMRKSLAVLSSAIAPMMLYSSAFAGVNVVGTPSTTEWPTNASFGGSLELSSGTSAQGGGPLTTGGSGPITFQANQASNQYAVQVLSETFLTPATGFTLGAIDLIRGGGGNSAAPGSISIHLFQLNTASYNSSSNNSVGGYYTLGNGGVEVGNDLLGGGNGVAITIPGANNATTTTEFDFNGSDRVALQPNTEYAVELWDTAAYPNAEYFFTSNPAHSYANGEVFARGANDAATIATFEQDHSTAYRGQALGSANNLLFAVYNANVPGPAFFDNTASGNWNDASQWSTGAVPNGSGAEADFLSPVSTFGTSGTANGTPYTRTDSGLTSNGNVYTDSAVTVGYMNFDNASSTYVIDGHGSLTMQTGTGNAAINVYNGTHEINLPLTIASNTVMAISSGATLNLADPVTIDSGASLSKSGSGTVNYLSTITVLSGGTISFSSPSQVTSLALMGASKAVVTSSSGSPNVLQANSITTGSGSQVDLTNNAMILHGSSLIPVATQLSSVAAALQNGYNKGNWNGTNGIVSSTAAGDASHLTTIGYMQSNGSAFDGINTTTNDVLIKYTVVGDANLDGVVNGADYQQIDAGYGSKLSGWQHGDFNYDGVVDGSDYSLLDNSYNQLLAVGSPLSLMATPSALVGSAAVPEPASLALLGLAGLGCLGRRRRKN